MSGTFGTGGAVASITKGVKTLILDAFPAESIATTPAVW